MKEIKLHIDGVEVSGPQGMTILEAAWKSGINIPTLCHKKELSSVGSCRICVVEVAGSPRLVGSCHTPISEGMVVNTGSERVLTARRTTMQLLLAGHTGPCVTDCGMQDCEVHQLASDLEVGPPPFRVRNPRSYPSDSTGLYIRRELSRCILCHRCIRACREIAGQDLLSMAYRGSHSKVVADLDGPMNKEVCKDCGVCVDFCPTTALSFAPGTAKGETSTEPKKKVREGDDRKRTKLLEMLKQEQRKNGHVSEAFIEETAAHLDLPVSDVYGVATFYSFISIAPQGRHVIRVCKSVSCDLKETSPIINTIQKTAGIKPGETSSNGRFSLVMTNCIGACDQAPAMLVDDDLHGNLNPEKVVEILKSYD
ncbi:MAG: NADH-quinone oxidoreductase subunit NuoE [Desulfomonilaceae bacterium]